MDPSWIFILFVIIAVTVAVIGGIYARKRRDALAAWAIAHGLEFMDYAPAGLIDRYSGFEPFGIGSSRSASNLIRGQTGEILWEIFEYHYTTGSGKDRSRHTWSLVAATVPMVFSRLRLRPEGLFDKVKGLIGFEDINFESEAFSRRYYVSCEDRKFAYDVIHPRMIEYLMELPNADWQIAGNLIVLRKSGTFGVEEIEQRMSMVQGLMQRLPEYLRQDRGARRDNPGRFG